MGHKTQVGAYTSLTITFVLDAVTTTRNRSDPGNDALHFLSATASCSFEFVGKKPTNPKEQNPAPFASLDPVAVLNGRF
jgi:hypothetical protein